MKSKNFFVLTLFLLFAMTAFSQSIGLRVGVNSTNFGVAFDDDITSEDEFAFDAVIRFQAGLVAEFPIAGPVGIETGLFYTGHGAKNDFLGTSYETRLDYLQLPLLLKLRGEVGQISLFLHAGPYASFAISGVNKFEIAGVGTTEDIDFGDKDGEYSRLDFGLLVGGGIGFGPIDVGLNYGYGLAKILNADNVRVGNRALSLTLSYRFRANQ